jgi:hypothetical protein
MKVINLDLIVFKKVDMAVPLYAFVEELTKQRLP